MNKNLEKKVILVTKRKNNGEEQFHSLMFTDRLGRIVRREKKYTRSSENIEYFNDTDKIIKISSTMCGEYVYDENGKLEVGREYTKDVDGVNLFIWIFSYDELGRIIQITKGSTDSIFGDIDPKKEKTIMDATIVNDTYTFIINGRKLDFTYFPNSSRKKEYKATVIKTDTVVIHNFYIDNPLNQWYSTCQYGKLTKYTYDENGLLTKKVSHKDNNTEETTTTFYNRIFN
jgi:YD repeat-containing protein